MNIYRTTRSSIQDNHALITPESHVQAVLPGWTRSKGIILIAPPLGARFVQYLALMDAGATAAASLPQVSRFLYVLEGAVELAAAGQTYRLEIDAYAYCPPGDRALLTALQPARLLLFEKPYVSLAGVAMPELLVGHEQDVQAAPFLGDPDAMLKMLLPVSPAFDFEINLFSFSPGAALPFVEVHVMEHGLLLLEGQGIYRLDESWYPVQAGDVIWMAPFCPQWFAAIGKTPARYLYYKDMNRNPLGAGQ
jgi:(S)-ureidoglycine aminohydrolase